MYLEDRNEHGPIPGSKWKGIWLLGAEGVGGGEEEGGGWECRTSTSGVISPKENDFQQRHFQGSSKCFSLHLHTATKLRPLNQFWKAWCPYSKGGTAWSCQLTSRVIVQELFESRGGRPGLSVLTSLLVSVDVDVKLYWTMLRHWSQLVPNMSTDIWGH